jgi:hypothetical protein
MPNTIATAKPEPGLTSPAGKATAARSTKTERALALLRRPKGVTIAELGKATGWQRHSVRGFISGTLKKRKGLEILSAKDDNGLRRYRVAASIR